MNYFEHKSQLDEQGHLTDEMVALSAAAMIDPALLQGVPPETQEHLEECSHCADRVADSFALFSSEPLILQRIVEFHGKSASKGFNVDYKRRLVYLSLAAMILILIAIGIHFFSKPLSPEKLFSEVFEPYPNLVSSKGADDTGMANAMLFYDLRDYDTAAVLLGDVLKYESSNVTAMLYLGVSCLAKGNAGDAIFWLEKASSLESSFIHPVMWYLALAYLREERLNDSRELLEKLTRAEGFYREKAQELLAKMD